MPGDPSSCCIHCLCSWLSQLKKRITSPFVPASPTSSHQYSRLPDDSIGVPVQCADTDVSPAPDIHRASASSASIHSTTDSVPACPPSCLSPSSPAPLLRLHVPLTAPGEEQLAAPNNHAGPELSQSGQNYWSAYPAPPYPPQVSPGQVSTYQGSGHMFNEAHNFTVNDSTFIQSNTTIDNFMEKLLQQTIIGAEFDSSARDPPQCHPGTRLAIIQHCLDFIAQCIDEGKLRWVVGPAGVGKSAIMQMVTENAPDGIIFASIFLSVDGRRDGSKTVLTMAYQLAVKCGPYRQFIRDQINFDPSLLQNSLSVQFNKFIVEPFTFGRLFEPSRRFLVVIDGLDECDDPVTQRKLLELVTDFCIAYPTSPIAWIIASRPEPHITSFFDDPKVQPAYTKEVMVIDSDETCEEVQRYLRDELKKIQLQHPALRRKKEWPLEHEFTKIALAAGGLFAYAATVIRYIGDPTHGGPAAQLRRVLELIDAIPKDGVAGKNHPMDQLDALYRRILSNVPDDVMINTRKLLLLRSHYRWNDLGFRELSSVLGLTEDDAYDAICHLHAVMKIPQPDQADDRLSYYHKSFDDFLHDFKRSGFSRNFDSESDLVGNRASLRIIEELHDDGTANYHNISVNWSGYMEGHCDTILLSWPDDDRFQMTDKELRVTLYKNAVDHIRSQLHKYGLQKSISCFHTLTTRFAVPPNDFPFDILRECAFEQFRNELANLGTLKQGSLRTFDYAAICGDVELQFTSPVDNNLKVLDPWNPSCKHDWTSVNGLEQRRGWSTEFDRYHSADATAKDDEDTDISRFHIATHQQQHEKWAESDIKRYPPTATCFPCSRRFAHYFMNNQDLPAMYFVDGSQMCYVEVTFVDPDDGMSEWRYRFLHSGRPSNHDVQMH